MSKILPPFEWKGELGNKKGVGIFRFPGGGCVKLAFNSFETAFTIDAALQAAFKHVRQTARAEMLEEIRRSVGGMTP